MVASFVGQGNEPTFVRVQGSWFITAGGQMEKVTEPYQGNNVQYLASQVLTPDRGIKRVDRKVKTLWEKVTYQWGHRQFLCELILVEETHYTG